MRAYPKLRLYTRAPWLLIVLTAGLAVGCAAQSPISSVTDTQTKLAQLAHASGDTAEELAMLAAAASRKPGDTAAQLRYANALAEAGFRSDALRVAAKAYESEPDNVSLGLLVGRLQLNEEEGDAAEATYRHLLVQKPDSLEAMNGVGTALVLRGDLPGAEKAFRHALAQAPNDVASRNNLGLALALQGNTVEAIPILERLFIQNGRSDRARSNLALANAVAGDRRRAVQLLTPTVGHDEAERITRDYAALNRASASYAQLPDQPSPTNLGTDSDASANAKTKKVGSRSKVTRARTAPHTGDQAAQPPAGVSNRLVEDQR